MSELLAPAGNYEAFLAAISNGADAIYLGMQTFGARAYADNFDYDLIKKVIDYAHLRNVKIYVTMNTIVFEDELDEAFKQIDKLYILGVDALIIQDLALIDYVVSHYPSLEAHASTQMGIEDYEGIKFCEKLGISRTVLARETPIEVIRNIKKKSKMSIEIFIHGALCVSYSGNCLMSGLIGYRSGNRGRCVGSCRKPYNLINITTNEIINNSYILSMKDLNTTPYIKDLLIADSLKIEGRMKEPSYVANLVRSYRDLLDNPQADLNLINNNLLKTFQRTFTKGYLFSEDKKNIVNSSRPNHFGYKIGVVTKVGRKCCIELNDTLNQGDQIRIVSKEEINLPVLKLYDQKNNLINSSSSVCYLEIKEKLNIGDIVYKTRDIKFMQEIEKTYPKEFRKFPLDIYINGKIGYPLQITASCENKYYSFETDFILQKSINKTTTKEVVFNQFNRLNETIYKLNFLEFTCEENSFIPLTLLNEIRQKIVKHMNEKRIELHLSPKKTNVNKTKFCLNNFEKKLAVFCNTEEQYEAALSENIDIIYYNNNVIRRNHTKYPNHNGFVLVGGYGGIFAYQGQEIITDFSLNVVNSKSLEILYKNNVNRITISHELNKNKISQMINNFYENNKCFPNLEMIVYGHSDLLYTKYCPLKHNNLCNKCKNNKYIIEDEYGQFPILTHEDCTTTILNGKKLNLIDDIEDINHISVFRIQLTIESYDESIEIIKKFKSKLKSMEKTHYFNSKTDTRGHYNKDIM